VKLFISVEHTRILSYLLWTLAYLSDGDDEQITIIFSYDISKRVLELMEYDNPALQAPALRTIGNLLTGDDIYTQVSQKKM
jgi:importin subunit alpha-1